MTDALYGRYETLQSDNLKLKMQVRQLNDDSTLKMMEEGYTFTFTEVATLESGAQSLALRAK